ncbi:MAG: heavy-metal-associated domain-containing protein [Catalinimonas sp.]
MKTLRYKTNINCGGCVATVTPYLNDAPGVEAWRVDTAHADKLLTVEGDFSDEEVRKRVEEAGFKIEPKRRLLGLF